MKRTEKLDLILKTLYECTAREEYYSLRKAIQLYYIPLSSDKALENKAKLLYNAGLIEYKNLDFDIIAKLTPSGYAFCETSSYSYPGFPIITHKC